MLFKHRINFLIFFRNHYKHYKNVKKIMEIFENIVKNVEIVISAGENIEKMFENHWLQTLL